MPTFDDETEPPRVLSRVVWSAALLMLVALRETAVLWGRTSIEGTF